MPTPPWDFSDSGMTFDNPGFTFDGGVSTPTLAQAPQAVPSVSHTTWLLDWETGDSCLDASGNIAVASAPYSIAQDVATQLSAFLGECWYDTTQGLALWQQILGKRPPASLVVSLLETQALLVPDVETATAAVGGINAQRGAVAQMIVTDRDGNTTTLRL